MRHYAVERRGRGAVLSAFSLLMSVQRIIILSSFLAIFSINYSAEQIPAIQVSNKVTPEKLGKILREILL